MRYRVILAATAFTMSAAWTTATAAPLMGNGNLAVIGAEQERASLANVNNAVYEDSTLYFDHHVRLKKLAGDPPQIELLYRSVVNCKRLTSGYASVQSVNYQTGKTGSNMSSLSDSDMTPMNRDSPIPGLCRRLQSGAPVRDALMENHDALLASFPRFAASIQDLLRPEKFEDGEAVEYEATELYRYLRRVNPEF